MHDCLTSSTIIVSSSSLRPLLLLLPPPVLLQGFLQLAGPQSASQEQPGDRETTTTLLQQHSQTQAINTAGEHLIIYFLPGSTPWQDIMARCHRCRPETNPAAPPEYRVRLIFGLVSAFFVFFFFPFFAFISLPVVQFNESQDLDGAALCLPWRVSCHESEFKWLEYSITHLQQKHQ